MWSVPCRRWRGADVPDDVRRGVSVGGIHSRGVDCVTHASGERAARIRRGQARRSLTAVELDTVLTWATGGNPRGSLEPQVPKVALRNDWALGPPDLRLALPQVVLPADQMEQTPGLHHPGWKRAGTLASRRGSPSETPSVVRSAVIAVKGDTGTEFGAERVLGTGFPARSRVIDRDNAAFDYRPTPSSASASTTRRPGRQKDSRRKTKARWGCTWLRARPATTYWWSRSAAHWRPWQTSIG